MHSGTSEEKFSFMFRSFEAAAMCQKELTEWKKVGEYIEQACELFLEHGAPDTGGIVLDKGAKYV